MVILFVGRPVKILSTKAAIRALFGTALLIFVTIVLNGCSPSPEFRASRVESRLTTMAELRSYEYIYREILYLGEQERFLGVFPTKDRRFLFSINLHVTAGVNLAQAAPVVIENDTTLILTLPSPQILSIDAKEDTIRQYFAKEYGGQLQLLELGDLLDQAKESIRADALSRGVLHQARAEAEDILTGLGHSLGFSSIRFVWQPNPSKDGLDG